MTNTPQPSGGKAEAFLGLHQPGRPLLLANADGVGSARVLASLGFSALATTSSGAAAVLGRNDGQMTREEALDHAAAVAAAVEVPVSADLENGFADDPAGVADAVRLAAQRGLAGCSIEDYTRDDARPIYDVGLAVERVAAAAEAAHTGAVRLVLTARAEDWLHGRTDLRATISRLQRYQDAGADVLFAPGLVRLEDIAVLVAELDRPVNVLAMRGCASVADLAAAGVARVSVGGAFNLVAVAALAEAASEFLELGTFGYLERAGAGLAVARRAFRK